MNYWTPDGYRGCTPNFSRSAARLTRLRPTQPPQQRALGFLLDTQAFLPGVPSRLRQHRQSRTAVMRVRLANHETVRFESAI
jgi:hypothetical protein